MALTLRTGIPPSVWAAEDPADITTAMQLLEEVDRATKAGNARATGPRRRR